MLDGAPRRLLLASFPSLVGSLLVGSLLVDSLLVGSLLVPVVPRSGATESEAPRFAGADEASGVESDDPETPSDDHDPGEPAEEIGPESAESDPPPAAVAATSLHARLRLCAGVAPARTAAPREGDSLRRLTVTSTERGPPRV